MGPTRNVLVATAPTNTQCPSSKAFDGVASEKKLDQKEYGDQEEGLHSKITRQRTARPKIAFGNSNGKSQRVSTGWVTSESGPFPDIGLTAILRHMRTLTRPEGEGEILLLTQGGYSLSPRRVTQPIALASRAAARNTPAVRSSANRDLPMETTKIPLGKGPPREGPCQLCGEHRPLVKSHIIPAAFFEKDPLQRMLSNSAGAHPRRMPIGVYDRIVCAECEVRFGPYDTYAAEVFLQDAVEFESVRFRGKLRARVAHNFDYRLLKLFSVSVIWRASVCSQSFYERVSLGPFERRARDMILAGDPGEAQDFATWWSIFDMSWQPGIMDPFFERWEGINAYRLYFGKVLGYVKIDRRDTPAVFREIVMRPGSPLVLVGRDFEGSADARAMIHVLRTSKGGI